MLALWVGLLATQLCTVNGKCELLGYVRNCQMAYSFLLARLPHTAGRSSAGTVAVNPRLICCYRAE